MCIRDSNITGITSGQKLFALFIAVPVLVGTNFCTGHHMGKAIRWVKDDSNKDQNGINI